MKQKDNEKEKMEKKNKENDEYSRDVYMIKSCNTPKLDLNKLYQDEEEVGEIQPNKEIEETILHMLKIYLPKFY